MRWADVADALEECDPAVKCRRVDSLWSGFSADAVQHEDPRSCRAGRPERPGLVSPASLPRRGLGSVQGRIALLHAVAHIEFNAINLALDAALRFAGMPGDYYRDWLSVAFDEARHFRLLETRLHEMGAAYGDLPAHNGL